MSDSLDPAATGGQTADPDGRPDGGAIVAPTETQEAGGDALAARLRKAEKQLQQTQNQLAQHQRAAEEKAKAEMTELDRVKAEKQEVESKLEATNQRFLESAKRNALKLAAKDAGARNVDAALKLADLSLLEVDDDGNVSGAEVAVKKLKKDFEFMFGLAATGGSGGANPGTGAPGSPSAEEIRKMNPRQLTEYKKSLRR